MDGVLAFLDFRSETTRLGVEVFLGDRQRLERIGREDGNLTAAHHGSVSGTLGEQAIGAIIPHRAGSGWASFGDKQNHSSRQWLALEGHFAFHLTVATATTGHERDHTYPGDHTPSHVLPPRVNPGF